MGTTERSESRTRGTTFKVQPAFVLVGAPGIGKSKIADALARDHFTEKLAVHDTFSGANVVALGLHADYRTELKVAIDRAVHLHSHTMPVVYTNSLIDSLAYALARVEIQATYGAGSMRQRETWALTMATIGLVLRDTFKADEIILLRADFEEDSDVKHLQTNLESILDGYEYNYTVVEVKDLETATEEVATVIEGYFD